MSSESEVEEDDATSVTVETTVLKTVTTPVAETDSDVGAMFAVELPCADAVDETAIEDEFARIDAVAALGSPSLSANVAFLNFGRTEFSKISFCAPSTKL